MSLIERLQSWHATRRARRHRAHEIAGMDRRALADIGHGRDELMAFLRYPQDLRRRMSRMAAVFGADIGRLERVRGAWAEAAHACGTCTHRDACARELDAAAGTTPARCSFCPNAATWRSLAPQQAA